MPNKLIKTDYNKYRRIHYWINKHAGRAYKCENHKCDGFSKHYEWANLSEKYKKTYTDWKMLCRKCHSLMDKSKFCKNGHIRTNINTKIRASGERDCLVCLSNTRNKYKPIRRIYRSVSWKLLMSQFSHLL